MSLLLAARIIAGCILVALGAAILLRRSRTTSALAFAVFALGLGGLYLLPVLGLPNRGMFAFGANVVILIGFWTMFLVFPAPLRRNEMHLLGVAFATGIAGTAFRFVPLIAAAAASEDASTLAGVSFGFVSSVGILAGVVLFPLRARSLAPGDRSAARSLAIFSVGVALFRGFDALDIIGAARGDLPLAALVNAVFVLGLPAVLWIAVILRGAHPGLARNTVLAHMVVVVAALLLSRLDMSTSLLSLAGALLLGFAILRGQIDGLDVKVRFAVSRSTVAAVFVAVFFVVSEAAQQYFGETTGSMYLGIGAAGALVFAIAPLQRAAERLAEKAVPASLPSDLSAVDRNEATYRRAVRWALRDEMLAQDEERDLVLIAAGLGITPARAFEIRDELEREFSITRGEVG